MGVPDIIVLAIFLALVFVCQKIFAEGIQNFRDALGGGPRPPTHPLPGDDSVIVNRRRSRSWPEL
jgi:hypothetical protein